jgi:beta-glucosidase
VVHAHAPAVRSRAFSLCFGLVSHGQVDASLFRVFSLRMRLGMFDPLDQQPYAQIPLSSFAAPESAVLNEELGAQGVVLLKNAGGMLPFTPGVKVAVVGPHAVSQEGLLEPGSRHPFHPLLCSFVPVAFTHARE